jgi:hypothetical protein
MTSVTAGAAVTLTSQWLAFEAGPLVDLDGNPAITLIRISDAAVQDTSTPAVVHVGTGTYSWTWNTAAGLAAGDYLATWNGLAGGSPVSSSETVTVGAALSGSYATVAQWIDYTGETPPANAALLLRRASRDIDGVLIAATYDAADADVILALQQATIEQALYGLDQGWENGIPGGYQSVSIGSVSLSRGASAGGTSTPAEISGQAFTILQLAGLTGMAPWTGG